MQAQPWATDIKAWSNIMNLNISPRLQNLCQRLALALPLALAICAPSVLAQSAFDTTSLSGGAAMNSLGNGGTTGNTSYTTGESPGFANMAGIKNGFTTKQQSGPTGTLGLNQTTTMGLAPVFGGGGYGSFGGGFGPGININIGPGGINAGINLPGGSGFPMPGPPGGEFNLSAPGFGSPSGIFGVGLPGGSFMPPGMSGSGFPGMPGSFSDPTIGANFNVGGANINVGTDLNTIESGLSSIGSDFGF
jgi:hypothetical protein